MGGTPRQVRNGQAVSDEAMAAFYRHRSEALRRTTTVAKPGTTGTPAATPAAPAPQPTVGVFDYIVSALKGHPGVR